MKIPEPKQVRDGLISVLGVVDLFTGEDNTLQLRENRVRLRIKDAVGKTIPKVTRTELERFTLLVARFVAQGDETALDTALEVLAHMSEDE